MCELSGGVGTLSRIGLKHEKACYGRESVSEVERMEVKGRVTPTAVSLPPLINSSSDLMRRGNANLELKRPLICCHLPALKSSQAG